MVKVALTGNYGSGKSTVLGIFRRFGAFCINADSIVAELLEDKDVLERIRKTAGSEVFDGSGLSKKKLANIIFTDKAVREAVEGIIHPVVIARIDGELSRSDAAVGIIEVPLLYEKSYEGAFDKVIAVYTDERTALSRLENSGVSRESAKQRLAAQMPIGQKMKRADYVIDNQGNLEETRKQAWRIYKELSNA